MLDTDTKRRIDTARDILVGKVPDPKSQVEQITISLIYKFMDDMDKEVEELEGKPSFFQGEFAKYSWSRIFDPRISGFELVSLYGEAIDKMNLNPNIPQLFRDIFKNAYLPYRDPETLKSFLKIINEFHYSHSEKLGDAYEYLLSILSSQGDAGQFRTPRHMIDFMVEVVSPQKSDKVLDPALGTAGFLISSYKQILKDNTKEKSGDKLTPEDRNNLIKNFSGYDISPDMVRISLVNMYLHGFSNPRIYEYDTLTSEDRWNEFYDIILANPPFMSPKGGIKPHKRFSIQANRSEVLFVDYICEHLTPTGKAGVIVPEGIIFQSGNAYKQLRKMLVDNYLWAVVSLPAGVFNPYSGVKTSILFIDKQLNKKSDNILFVKIENDGYDLGAQRREIEKNDLPDVLKILKEYKTNLVIPAKAGIQNNVDKLILVPKEQIALKNDYNLSIDRYRINENIQHSNYEVVRLGDVVEVISGQSPESEFYNDKKQGLPFYQGKTEFGEMYIGEPKIWTTKITKTSIKNDILMSVRAPVGPVNIATQEICIGRGIAAIRPNEKILQTFLFYFLKSIQEEIKGGGGSVFDSINRNQIMDLEIPLPPLSVQQEIVNKIEGYQAIINGARQVVENYKPQIDIDPEWQMVELGEVITLQRGYDLPKQNWIEG
ncbi:MAG TPA: N-6 DNA methylase [Ignavibacteria bacterium]